MNVAIFNLKAKPKMIPTIVQKRHDKIYKMTITLGQGISGLQFNRKY